MIDSLLKLIFENILKGWYQQPTVSVLETMTHPIEELTFPTVTICPQNRNPDRWGPTIKLFNQLRRRCDPMK